MLLSMTGYSCTTFFLDIGNGERISFSVEIKTINARFFEAVCKLPSLFGHLEVKIISLLQQHLIRGRAYVIIKLGQESESFEPVLPCYKVVEGYLTAAKQIQEQYKLQGNLSIADIFQLPHVFVAEKRDLDPEHETTILQAVANVAEQVSTGRATEGETLLIDLEKNFHVCYERMQSITEHFEKLMQNKKQLIAEQTIQLGHEDADLGVKLQLDDLYAALNKIDVHEEITRFNSHLTAIKACIGSDQKDKGKRLDFILQELLRETNTIMAKCSNYDISAAAVDIKVALEKCREQVQNLV